MNLSCKKNKIVLISAHTLESGVGSRRRIYSILKELSTIYGNDNIEWINIFPPGIRYFFDIKFFKKLKNLKKKFKKSYKLHLIYFAPLKINIITEKIFSIYIFLYLFFRYKDRKNLIFWSEKGLSAKNFMLFKKKYSIPLIVDVHGTTDEIIQGGYLNKKIMKKYVENIYNEIKIFKNSEAVVCVSNKMLYSFKSKYLFFPKNNEVIPNIPDRKYFNYNKEKREEFRKKLNIKENFVFIYSGGVYRWQCIDQMLKFFISIENNRIYRDLNLKFIMLINNDIESKKYLNNKKEKLIQKNIMIKTVQYEEVSNYLQASDAGIIFRENITTNIVSSPTKAAEYLYSGLPIFCTAFVGDISEIVKKENIGYIYDFKEFNNQKIFNWCQDIKTYREKYSSRAVKTAEKYFNTSNYKKIKKIIDNINL